MAQPVIFKNHFFVRRQRISNRRSLFQSSGHRHRSINRCGIVAAASGTVTISTYSYSAGNYIMIHHGGESILFICTVPNSWFQRGRKCRRTVNCKVGSNGYSTGPHLHFGIRVNGSYVNPVKYVAHNELDRRMTVESKNKFWKGALVGALLTTLAALVIVGMSLAFF